MTDLKEEWTEHEYTRFLLKQNEKAKQQALQRLLNYCRTSSDTAIATAYAGYSLHTSLDSLLQGGELKP